MPDLQQLSGQIMVAAAGTAVQGPDVKGSCFFIKALAANTNPVYVGSDGVITDKVPGDVTSSNGYQLSAGESVEVYADNLNVLFFDVQTNGEGFCWLRKL